MKSTATSDLIDRAQELLDAGKPSEALDLITRNHVDTARGRNARAVCLLRMGQAPQAANILRDLVYPRGTTNPAPDVPPAYHANYVTAMLVQGQVMAACGVMAQAPDPSHPTIVRVRKGLARWRKSLGPVGRLLGLLGIYPQKPVDLGFSPGELL